MCQGRRLLGLRKKPPLREPAGDLGRFRGSGFRAAPRGRQEVGVSCGAVDSVAEPLGQCDRHAFGALRVAASIVGLADAIAAGKRAAHSTRAGERPCRADRLERDGPAPLISPSLQSVTSV